MANKRERVEQIHECCLNSKFRRDYYRRERDSISKRCSHSDFTIGLSAALGGGSGISVQSHSFMIWPCAALTGISTILSLAKVAYSWNDRLKKSSELTQYYDQLAADYQALVDDMNDKKTWDAEFENKHFELRAKYNKPPTDYPYLQGSEEELKAIQNGIKQRVNYKLWWKPNGAAPPSSQTEP